MRSAARVTAPLRGFDFSSAMAALCRDIVERVPVFRHIDMNQVFVGFTQCRNRLPSGTQARLTPMRFDGGSDRVFRFGKWWRCQKFIVRGTEMLYLLDFFLPRFHLQDVRQRYITVMHELFHISPDFDGDIRRFEGRCNIHGRSQREYDDEMDFFVSQYLHTRPDRSIIRFLELDYTDLIRAHDRVIGMRCPRPKLIPVKVEDL